jgi:predicted nucleic acid-binding protein
MTPAEIRDLADGLMFLAELVEPENITQTDLRGPADQPVLATLKSAKADYLLTGDKDLLALANRFPILTPTEFWSRHGI